MPDALPTVDVSALRALIAADPATELVDLRTPAEFGGCHIGGAVNAPLAEIDQHLDRLTAHTAGRLVLVCQSGDRATRCQARLARAGATDAAVLVGGMNAWRAAGAPVVGGTARWSLERQVRLVAGSIVLVSVAAGQWWGPAVWVAGFIGAGLTFAALTNTCGMALLLARLPHNRSGRG
ncbi:sulfurtransferase [Nocardiopsis sp. CNR-923]|uniref:rhodanese-like domain-containing protein n=1 Tax=Nocardiopsis sp. CNR-923 TaxID=1904965 RepID=UPI0009614380|nr:rhodanese-like domain-containing protein [Nocardiopsis sp. CNR-923]OLT26664.1 sulfurtransferase [Nocardiopsis sp. CNR-923]